MNKKALIIIGILALVVVVVAVVLIVGNNKGKTTSDTNQNLENKPVEEFVQTTADGTKLNTSQELKKEKKLGDLVFTSIQLTNKNGQSVLLANVTNSGSKATDLKEVNIIILDKEGKELGKVGGVIIPLKAGQSTQFSSSTQKDYANAYDFKVEEKK